MNQLTPDHISSFSTRLLRQEAVLKCLQRYQQYVPSVNQICAELFLVLLALKRNTETVYIYLNKHIILEFHFCFY